MMKKIIAMMLALLMVFSLAACGEKTPEPDKETPDASVSDVVEDTESVEDTENTEPEVSVETEPAEGEDLWENTDVAKQISEAIGKNFGNAFATNESIYNTYNEETKIAELSFDDPETGMYVFARMMKAEEWDDTIMKDMAVDFTDAKDDTEVMGHAGKIVTGTEGDKPMIAGMWFDSNEKIMYALAVVGEGGTLNDYAAKLFNPSELN